MNNKVDKYLIYTFGISWIIQVVVALLFRNKLIMIGQILMAVMMFVPLLGVILSGNKLSELGWKLNLKKNVKILLFAWFGPAILSTIGMLLYFVVFSSHFDLSGEYLIANIGMDAFKQMEARGLTVVKSIFLSIAACVSFAPLINMLFAIGEEAGWRGYLYPQLKERFGKRLAWIIGGIIWGLWHAPLIWLIGYEYGTDYFGYPVVGILIFCIITIAFGIGCDYLYEKSDSLWFPSIFHGAINAAGTVPFTLCIVNTGTARLLGPAPIGLLAGLPFIILALFIFLKSDPS